MSWFDVLGGLLAYDAFARWQRTREVAKNLPNIIADIGARLDARDREYVALRRARPAQVRAALLMDWAYRTGIQPAISYLDEYPSQSDAGRRLNATLLLNTGTLHSLNGAAALGAAVDRPTGDPKSLYIRAAGPFAVEAWRRAGGYAALMRDATGVFFWGFELDPELRGSIKAFAGSTVIPWSKAPLPAWHQYRAAREHIEKFFQSCHRVFLEARWWQRAFDERFPDPGLEEARARGRFLLPTMDVEDRFPTPSLPAPEDFIMTSAESSEYESALAEWAAPFWDEMPSLADWMGDVAEGQPQQDIPGLIERLAVLRDRGLITYLEFEAKKQELLKRI
jgi:hypothetical protein